MIPADILRALLKDAVNQALTVAAFWLIRRGVLSPDALSATNLSVLAIGISSALISIGVSLYRRIKTHNWIHFLRAAEPDVPLAFIGAKVDALPLLTILPAAK